MRLVCALVIAIALALPPSAAWAQDQVVFVVALSNLPPWKMMQDTTPTGIDVDILREAAMRMNVGLEFKPGSFGECLTRMKSGKADLMTGLLMTPAREKYLVYVTPPYSTQTASAFYALKKRASAIDRYEYLRRLRTGVKRGEKHFPQFDIDRELRKTRVNSMEDGFRRLKNGSIGAFIANEIQADWWLAAHPKTDSIVDKAPLKYHGYQPMHFAFSRKSRYADRAGQLGGILVQLIQDGTIDAVLRRYSIGR